MWPGGRWGTMGTIDPRPCRKRSNRRRRLGGSMSTLEAAALLAELNARGIAVAATPRGSLRCTPKSAITEDTLEKIREHKPELLSLITQKNPSSPIVPTVPPTDNPD